MHRHTKNGLQAPCGGTGTQAYATRVLTTLRKGLTTLETAGYAAGWLLRHPMDWKDVELARASSNVVEPLSLPKPPAVHSWTNDPTRRCVCVR